jgi:hypothetical protein
MVERGHLASTCRISSSLDISGMKYRSRLRADVDPAKSVRLGIRRAASGRGRDFLFRFHRCQDSNFLVSMVPP